MSAAAAPLTPARRLRSIFSGSVGNLVEWYDWYVYAAFSLYFAQVFFPSGDRTTQLLNTAAIFAVGFLMRPLGGWLLGRYADRHGRKAALLLSVLMMCAGSLIITFTPGYDSIGVAAPGIECGQFLARIEQHGFGDQRPRPLRAGTKLRQPPAVGVGGDQRAAVGHRRRQREGLAPAPGAQVDHRLARARADRLAGKLAAAVLHLDPPVAVGIPWLDLGAGFEPQPVRRGDRLGFGGKLDARAVGLERVDPDIERRAAEQRGGFVAGNVRGGQRFDQPLGSDPSRRNLFTLGYRRRAIIRTVEQRGERRIVRREPQHRRAPALRHRPARADRGIDQLADRAPVLRPGKAVRAEPVGEDAVGRRALAPRRLDHRIEQLYRRLDAGCGRHRANPQVDAKHGRM